MRKSKKCICFATSADECQCGAWHKKPEPYILISELEQIFHRDGNTYWIGDKSIYLTAEEYTAILQAAKRAADRRAGK